MWQSKDTEEISKVFSQIASSEWQKMETLAVMVNTHGKWSFIGVTFPDRQAIKLDLKSLICFTESLRIFVRVIEKKTLEKCL